MKNIPIGVDDFLKVNSQYYVDKTLIIKEIIDNCIGKSLLVTRPRRFGKSLTLSMVEYFFTNKGKYLDLFKDKLIYKEGEKYISYLNNYPVIHLNMKDLLISDINSLLEQTIKIISNEFSKYPELEKSDKLLEIEKKEFKAILNREKDEAFYYVDSIKLLSRLLYKQYNKHVIILIDEYDTPLETAFQKGFYDDVIDFYKKFYSSTLKSNEYALFSFTTGVLEIAKESIFSDLNNLYVCSVFDDDLIEYFGFTTNEVKKLLLDFNINIPLDEIKQMYSGYGNKRIEIFNPWSILNFINKEKLLPYWVNTGSNNSIIALIEKIPSSIKELNEIINNKENKLSINNSISYRDINNDMNSLLSYLIQTGYLSALSTDAYDNYIVKIPNREIEEVFEKEIIARGVKSKQLDLAYSLKNAIIKKDVDIISNILKDYILESYSYFELKNEKEYQIMLTGILAVLFSDYVVKNKVMNSFGRCDIMISPKNNQDLGLIIEVKKYKNIISSSRMENYCDSALKQIKENEYYSELTRRNIKTIMLCAFIFDDKNNKIKIEELNA